MQRFSSSFLYFRSYTKYYHASYTYNDGIVHLADFHRVSGINVNIKQKLLKMYQNVTIYSSTTTEINTWKWQAILKICFRSHFVFISFPYFPNHILSCICSHKIKQPSVLCYFLIFILFHFSSFSLHLYFYFFSSLPSSSDFFL